MAKHSPFHGADSQDHGRLSVEDRSKHFREENLYVSVGLLGPYCKKEMELWARPPVLTPSFTGEPQLSSYRRRFQTGENREKLAVPWSELQAGWKILKNCTHFLLGPSFRKSNDGRITKKRFLFVTVWEPGTGGQDVGTRSSTTRWTQCRTRRCDNEQ